MADWNGEVAERLDAILEELAELRHKIVGALVTALETRQEVRAARQELYRLDDKVEALWGREKPEPIRPEKPDWQIDIPPDYYEKVAQERLSGVEAAVAELRDHEDYLYGERDKLKRRIDKFEETLRKLTGRG
jgi:SpoVK/Ycf46/Vps4 family AAA+-type ATPase